MVEVEFTMKELHVQVGTQADGLTEFKLVGETTAPGCLRWMPASEVSLFEDVRRPHEARMKERRQVQDRRLLGEQFIGAIGADQGGSFRWLC